MQPVITRMLAACVALTCGGVAITGSSVELLAQTPSPTTQASGAPFDVPFEAPAWAFPRRVQPAGPAPASVGDSGILLHVPDSRAAFTQQQVDDLFEAVDWHPETHPAMPTAVATGRRPIVMACGSCHLPDGAGRPENATLAGLPAAYIVEQITDMRSRARKSAHEPYGPMDYMQKIADSVTASELDAVARYYSRLQPSRRSRVVETTEIPRPIPQTGLYFPAPGGAVEPLGERLIEMPEDPARHDARDAALTYIAYVPPSSLARGRALATTGSPGGAPPCASCHGPQLRGVGLIPPLAGRFPSYIVRQLLAFKTGARSTPASVPMRDVAATLSLADMIAAAAYAGSQQP
jgi:cytochrome c553